MASNVLCQSRAGISIFVLRTSRLYRRQTNTELRHFWNGLMEKQSSIQISTLRTVVPATEWFLYHITHATFVVATDPNNREQRDTREDTKFLLMD